MYGNPQRLYVIELADGVIKAGITSRADERIQQHARNFSVRRHFLTDQFVRGVEAERELLKRLARIGFLVRGREWFSGVRFSQAAQLAKQIARQFTNARPVSSGLTRRAFAALRFDDAEIALLDEYCAKVGTGRSAACRDLVLQAIVDLVHGQKILRAHQPETH